MILSIARFQERKPEDRPMLEEGAEPIKGAPPGIKTYVGWR